MNGTVLLIEADQHDGKTVAEALGHEGFRLVVCAQPLDALRFVDASVDLVICDLATNRNRAFELLRLWRQRSKNPPFLFLVDGGDVQSAVDAMKVGASDCLTKPIESARLHQSVGQFLGKTNAAERFRPAEAAHDIADLPHPLGNGSFDVPAGTSLEDLERVAVQQALEQHRGNRTHAARELGISVRTLQRKLKAWRPQIFPLERYSSGGKTLQPWY